MEKHLHIICLEIPYPVDYGGVFDLFYKLAALQQQGVKIYLHCFTKSRKPQSELNKYCENVFYYQRKTTRKSLSSKLPYIVASRIDETLENRLLQDDFPILMEGVHCTYITNDARFKKRKMFVRIYNVENEYYKTLFRFSHNLKKEIYYLLESKRLYKYENKLTKGATAFWTVALHDAEYYRQEFNCKNVDYLPLFIPGWQIQSQEGMGTYCLYHGNLEVEENEYAVNWLIKYVFKHLDIPLIIAGKNPASRTIKLAQKYKHVHVIANPTDAQMHEMILKAHIHVLPSFNNTGIKIKLLNALFNGRHCVVNNAMIEGTTLKDMCHVVDDVSEFAERIQLLYHQPFTAEEKAFRKKLLHTEFLNETNAKQMVEWVWGTNV